MKIIKNIFKKTTTVAITLIFLLVLSALGSVIFDVINKREPTIFGYKLYYIMSDSMTPEINVGDFVLSKVIRSEEDIDKYVKVGESVTFLGTTGEQNGKIITHKVVEAPYLDANTGKRYIVTQGVKTGSAKDAPLPIENIRAVKVARLPILGKIFTFLRSTGGIIFVISLVVVIAALSALKHIRKASKKPKTEEDK